MHKNIQTQKLIKIKNIIKHIEITMYNYSIPI